MPRMDGLWLMNKRDNKQIALYMIIILVLEVFVGLYTYLGLTFIGYSSILFRIMTFAFLLWIGIGLWKRKIAAI